MEDHSLECLFSYCFLFTVSSWELGNPLSISALLSALSITQTDKRVLAENVIH